MTNSYIPIIETDQTQPLPGDKRSSSRVQYIGKEHMDKLKHITKCYPEYATKEQIIKRLIDQAFEACYNSGE